jgi:hypothetical protein
MTTSSTPVYDQLVAEFGREPAEFGAYTAEPWTPWTYDTPVNRVLDLSDKPIVRGARKGRNARSRKTR